jgi:hypothetical protein
MTAERNPMSLVLNSLETKNRRAGCSAALCVQLFFLLFILCVPVLCAPAKSVRADAASAKALQRKQVLKYYIPVCLLTQRISYVQLTENDLEKNPQKWFIPHPYDPQHPNDNVWARKMRAQILYIHKLRQEAKRLVAPPACQPANQDLTASLAYLEIAYTKLCPGQTQDVHAKGGDDAATALENEGSAAADKSLHFQGEFLLAIEALQQRFDLPIARYNVTDWPSAAMG